MWQGKNKAITFSFDDGCLQDKRLIEIFDKYNLKCSFNLNSGMLGKVHRLDRNGKNIPFEKFKPQEIKEIYKNHEVCSHTLTHPNLCDLDCESVKYQVEEDVKILSELVGYKVKGFAYPGGSELVSLQNVDCIKKTGAVSFARTTTSSYNFELPNDLMILNPTVYYVEDCLFDICKKFIGLNADRPQLLYIWGHSFEMDAEFITWEKMEELCKMISNKDDIFYGTNSQVLLK